MAEPLPLKVARLYSFVMYPYLKKVPPTVCSKVMSLPKLGGIVTSGVVSCTAIFSGLSGWAGGALKFKLADDPAGPLGPRGPVAPAGPLSPRVPRPWGMLSSISSTAASMLFWIRSSVSLRVMILL